MGYLFTLLCRFFETLILSAGMHLTLSSAGIFFLGLPVGFSASAYAMVIAQRQGIGWGLSILAGLGAGLAAGLLFAWAQRKVSTDSFAVLTLSGLLAFDALLKSWDSVTGGVLGIPGVQRPFTSLATLTLFQALLAGLVVALHWLILRSSFGRSLRAIKESPETVASLGTSETRVGTIAIVLASVLGSVAGILSIWRIQFLDPTFGGIGFLLQAMTVAILAYRPKTSGLVWASLLVVLIPEGLRFLHFPSSAVGHLRLLLYSLLVIVLMRGLGRRSVPAERAV